MAPLAKKPKVAPVEKDDNKKDENNFKMEDKNSIKDENNLKKEDKNSNMDENNLKKEDKNSNNDENNLKEEDKNSKKNENILKKEDKNSNNDENNLKKEDNNSKKNENILMKEDKNSTAVEPLGGAVLQQIFSAMNMSSSHHATCGGGHLYAIGDCGSPRQASRCPEPGCGLLIGGHEDRLTWSNRRAVGVVGPLNIHDVFDYIRDALKPYYRISQDTYYQLCAIRYYMTDGSEEDDSEYTQFRDLLLLKNMATLAEKRQNWLKAARDVSTIGKTALVTSFLALAIKLTGNSPWRMRRKVPGGAMLSWPREEVKSCLGVLLSLVEKMAGTPATPADLKEISTNPTSDPRASMLVDLRQIVSKF